MAFEGLELKGALGSMRLICLLILELRQLCSLGFRSLPYAPSSRVCAFAPERYVPWGARDIGKRLSWMREEVGDQPASAR